MEQQPSQPKKRRRPLVIIGIVVGVLVVLCLCVSIFGALAPGTNNSTTVAPVVERADQTTQSASDAGASEPTQPPQPTKTPRPGPTAKPTATPLARIGDSVVLDGVTYRVVSAENTGNTFKTEKYSTPLETSGMFILLSVEITNTGMEPLALQRPGLLDADGREYAVHGDAWITCRAINFVRWKRSILA